MDTSTDASVPTEAFRQIRKLIFCDETSVCWWWQATQLAVFHMTSKYADAGNAGVLTDFEKNFAAIDKTTECYGPQSAQPSRTAIGP